MGHMTLTFNKHTQVYLHQEAILVTFIAIRILFIIRGELHPFWNRMRRVICHRYPYHRFVTVVGCLLNLAQEKTAHVAIIRSAGSKKSIS